MYMNDLELVINHWHIFVFRTSQKQQQQENLINQNDQKKGKGNREEALQATDQLSLSERTEY